MNAMAGLPPDELARQRSANRRVGWCLVALALAVFLLSLFLKF
jgi:CHASE3 domain sensor protein